MSIDSVHLGDIAAEKVYVGDTLVWPTGPRLNPTFSGTGSLAGTATAVAAFTPISLSGLGLWLDASRIIGLADGASVNAWPDSSGSGHGAVATAANDSPVYRPTAMNGHPAVEFVGTVSSGHTLRIPGWGTALSGKTQYTLFQVMINRATGFPPVILTAPYEANSWKWLTELDALGGVYWGHVGYRNYLSTQPLNIGLVYSFQFLPTAPHPHFYVNGTEITSYNVYSGDLLPAVPDIGADVQFGSYDTGHIYGVDGYISEVIWYDHALTTAERLQVEGYLNAKWFA